MDGINKSVTITVTAPFEFFKNLAIHFIPYTPKKPLNFLFTLLIALKILAIDLYLSFSLPTTSTAKSTFLVNSSPFCTTAVEETVIGISVGKLMNDKLIGDGMFRVAVTIISL